MSRARVPTSLAIALLLGGCVYYNGMYNTKRLAGSARQAERDGRPFEANNLWGQVITRADSLARDALVADAAGASDDALATVLLSPAAASFDMFADYAARGRAFKDAVADLVAARARSRP